MAVKSTRRRQLEAAALYPLDWVEERSGLVGYTKWFLFRKVPRDISWAQTLGAASLTAFIVQAVTGVFLAMYYKPDPDNAYASIQNITEEVTLGWLVRGMHKWGASARSMKYYKAYPGVHVDGVERWLYPIPTPGSTG